MSRILCGTPELECSAGLVGASHGLHLSIKAHSTRDEAFKCYTRWLKKTGYVQIGPREFTSPVDGTCLVLTKRSKFGGYLRRGKSAEGAKGKSRVMPERGGLIY